MKLLTYFFLVTALVVPSLASAQKGRFLTSEAFHELAFPDQAMQWQTLWVNKALRADMEKILNHSVGGLRIRYWGHGSRTAWIFEEIGKELPITVGVVVSGDAIEQIQILEYRESRGGEVRYPFFTSQFSGVKLKIVDERYKLDSHIDGITGATLSVRALKKIATLALFCHQQTAFGKSNTVPGTDK
jgi:FMN-binding protein